MRNFDAVALVLCHYIFLFQKNVVPLQDEYNARYILRC